MLSYPLFCDMPTKTRWFVIFYFLFFIDSRCCENFSNKCDHCIIKFSIFLAFFNKCYFSTQSVLSFIFAKNIAETLKHSCKERKKSTKLVEHNKYKRSYLMIYVYKCISNVNKCLFTTSGIVYCCLK